MRQYLQKSKPIVLMLPQTLGTTVEGTGVAYIDRIGYDSLILCAPCAVNSAGNGGAKLTLKVYEGDTTTPATEVTFNGTAETVDVSSASVPGFKSWFIDLRGLKRYIKATLTPASMASTTVVAGLQGVLGDYIAMPGMTAAVKANGETEEVSAIAPVVLQKA